MWLAYARRQFDAWCREQGAPATPLPAPPKVVAFYCASLADRGASLNTILLALAAIGSTHRAAGLRFERSAPALHLVLANIRNKLGAARRPPTAKPPSPSTPSSASSSPSAIT